MPWTPSVFILPATEAAIREVLRMYPPTLAFGAQTGSRRDDPWDDGTQRATNFI